MSRNCLAVVSQLSRNCLSQLSRFGGSGVTKTCIATKVESEKALLQSSNPMDGLHTEVKTTLLAPGQAQHAQFENDFTPVHWAAQSGRRDLLAYLLRDPGLETPP
eukprot:246146-Amphidinium_carterae.1